MSIDLKLKVDKNNTMGMFYPISTRGESKLFKWEVLTHLFICEIYGLEILNKEKLQKTIMAFEDDCKSSFIELLDDPRAWDHLYKIYFQDKNLGCISPKLSIYSLMDHITSKNIEKRFLGLAKTLLKSKCIYNAHPEQLNFIEKIITTSFDKTFRTSQTAEIDFVNYFPKLSKIFSDDLEFLTRHPKYLIENIQLFIQLYMCVYTSQLSLTINSWRNFKEEKAYECYFILDFEKASRERNHLTQRGYKAVEKNLSSIFPILAMTESLQKNSTEEKKPLWKFYESRNLLNLNDLIKYCQDFACNRKLQLKNEDIKTVEEAFDELSYLFKEQFSKGTERASRNDNVIKDIKNIILKPFMQSRGSVGSLYVLNQEYLLLLTNLVIGDNEQLRLYELIKGFETRGIFFDRESYKTLVMFYERLGNVEKMSDSGDAIYVKKTI